MENKTDYAACLKKIQLISLLPKSIKMILIVIFLHADTDMSFKGYCPVPKSACAVQRCSTRSSAYLHSVASSVWRLQSNVATLTILNAHASC